MKRTGTVRLIVTGAVLALGLAGAGLEFPVFVRTFFPKKATTLVKRISGVRKKCAEQFPLREGFVTLNGFFVRLAGQHRCNGVVRTKPAGLLINPRPNKVRMRSPAERMRRFADFCKTKGAAFLYVQSPRKLDSHLSLLPPGVRDASYENADGFLAVLERKKVPFVDWRKEFVATPDLVRANFYRTDHHWNTDASFAAAGLLTEEIISRCSVPVEDAARARELLRKDSWDREIVPQCFLGSLGKRTGPGFSGYDDLVVMRPRFETKMSMEIPSAAVSVCGTFEETIMRRSGKLAAIKNGFVSDAYSMVYIGGLYPLARHENPLAPLKLKVLLIGDSFARPVEAFLSVSVRSLTMVDPRRCNSRKFKVSQLVARERPDIVIQLQNPSSFSADKMNGPKTGKAVMFEYGL